jgi:hypothetical protein
MKTLSGLKSQAKWKLPKEVNNFLIELFINNHSLSLLDIFVQITNNIVLILPIQHVIVFF